MGSLGKTLLRSLVLVQGTGRSPLDLRQRRENGQKAQRGSQRSTKSITPQIRHKLVLS